jgi:hypothetical protein
MPLLRFLLDRDPLRPGFCSWKCCSGTDSSSFESLAGRLEFIEMRGFTLDKPIRFAMRALAARRVPLVLSGRYDYDSMKWRTAFIQALWSATSVCLAMICRRSLYAASDLLLIITANLECL